MRILFLELFIVQQLSVRACQIVNFGCLVQLSPDKESNEKGDESKRREKTRIENKMIKNGNLPTQINLNNGRRHIRIEN